MTEAQFANPSDDEGEAVSLSRAALLVRQGRFKAAIGAYRALVAAEPECVDAWRHLALLQAAVGDHFEARAGFEAALGLTPDDLELRRDLAQILFAMDAAGEAVAQYQFILDRAPDDIAAMSGLGTALAATGAVQQASEILEAAHARAPDDLGVNSALGKIHLDAGAPERAIDHLAKAAAQSPQPAPGNNLATAYLRAGEPIKARQSIEAVLASAPDYAIGWHTSGLIALDLGQPVRAIPAFRKALSLAPELVAPRYGLAQSLKQSHDYEAALAAYQSLLRELPPSTDLLRELAHTLERLSRYDEAVEHLREAVRLTPEDAPSWSLLGICYANLKRPRDGIEACRRALELAPERPTAWIVKARCHWEADEPDPAMAHLAQALEIIDDDIEQLTAVAVILEGMKQHALAAKAFRRVLDLRPGDACATSRLLDIALSVCDWQDYDRFVDDLAAHIQADLAAGRPLGIDVFNLQALPLSYALIADGALSRARAIADDAAGPAGHVPFDHASPGPASGRIRLGYALAYTHKHSLPLVLKELVAAHDRDRFEVFGYSIDACDGSDFSRAYRAAFDHFADVPVASPHAAAARIHQDGPDVLIDVTGLTSQNCMPIMSFRPAPVQAHGFGYSITTGADYIDYLITDPTYVPPEWAALGPEQPVYLPDTFMPTIRPEVATGVVVRADYGLPVDAVVFANFNHPCKFEPSIFEIWMRLLQALPGSVLWLGSWLPETQDNLRREAEARSVDGARLVFSRIVAHDEHCARLALADLALDNRYHGGGVTTVDALWVGLPVVTLRGEAPAARLGATLLTAAGVEELIVADLEAYEDLALALARDPARRERLSAELLRRRETSALFDADRFRRHFEDAVGIMVDRHRAGRPPARINVPRR